MSLHGRNFPGGFKHSGCMLARTQRTEAGTFRTKNHKPQFELKCCKYAKCMLPLSAVLHAVGSSSMQILLKEQYAIRL